MGALYTKVYMNRNVELILKHDVIYTLVPLLATAVVALSSM